MADLTIAEAAIRLGISKQAMRTRVRRGQANAHKDAHGQWLVTVSDDASNPASDIAPDVPDAEPDATRDVGGRGRPYDADTVIAMLREQLLIKDRQISELHVMLQTAQRQLPETIAEAPQAPLRDAETAGQPPAANASQRGAPRAEQASQRPRWPWWMRLLGGK